MSNWFVRSDQGQWSHFRPSPRRAGPGAGHSFTIRQGYPALRDRGQAAPAKVGPGNGGDRKLASQIPGVGAAWSGASYQERLASGQAPLFTRSR